MLPLGIESEVVLSSVLSSVCLSVHPAFVHVININLFFFNHYAPVSQANLCNITFTAGNLFPSHWCIGWPKSSPHWDLNPDPQLERQTTYQLSFPSLFNSIPSGHHHRFIFVRFIMIVCLCQLYKSTCLFIKRYDHICHIVWFSFRPCMLRSEPYDFSVFWLYLIS